MSGSQAIKTGAWDPEEDELLYLWQSKLGNKWSEVARHIPGRTGQQCAQRWRHKVNPNIRRDKWTAEEDAHLISLVRTFGVGKWAEIARHCQGRTDQQCMGRWRRHLDPAIKRDSWTPEEDAKLTQLHLQYGTSWSRISRLLKGRTSQQCRARWHQLHGGRAGRSGGGGSGGNGAVGGSGGEGGPMVQTSQRKRGGNTRRRQRYSSSDEDEAGYSDEDDQDDSQATDMDQLPAVAARKQRPVPAATSRYKQQALYQQQQQQGSPAAGRSGLYSSYPPAQQQLVEEEVLLGEEGYYDEQYDHHHHQQQQQQQQQDTPSKRATLFGRGAAAGLAPAAAADGARHAPRYNAEGEGDSDYSHSGSGSDEEEGGEAWGGRARRHTAAAAGVGGSSRRPGAGLLADTSNGLPPTPNRGLAAGQRGSGEGDGTPMRRALAGGYPRGGLGEPLFMSPQQQLVRGRGGGVRGRGRVQHQQPLPAGGHLWSSPDYKYRPTSGAPSGCEEEGYEEEPYQVAGRRRGDAEDVDEEEAAGAETLLAMASVVEHEPCSVRCSSDFIAGTTPTKRPARCLPEMRLSDGLSPSPFKKPRGGRLSGSGGLMAWSAARPARGGRAFDRDAGGQAGVDQDADMCDLGSEGCQDCGGLEGDIVSPRGGLDQAAPGFGGPGVGGGTEASHAGSSNLTGAAAAAGSSLFLSPPRQMVPRWASLDSTPSKPPLGEGGLLSSGGRGAYTGCMTPVSARDGAGSLSAATLAALQSPQTMGMNAIEPYMTPFTKMNGLAKGLTKGRGASATPELTGAKAKVGLPFTSPPGCGGLFSPSRLFSPDSGSRGRATRSRLGGLSGGEPGTGGGAAGTVQGPCPRNVSRQLGLGSQLNLGASSEGEGAGAGSGPGSPRDPVTAYSNQQRSRAAGEGAADAPAAFGQSLPRGVSPSQQARALLAGTASGSEDPLAGEERLSQTAADQELQQQQLEGGRSRGGGGSGSAPPAAAIPGMHRVVRRLDRHEAWGVPSKQSHSGGSNPPTRSCSPDELEQKLPTPAAASGVVKQEPQGAPLGGSGSHADQQGAEQQGHLQQQQQQGEEEGQELTVPLVPLFVGEAPKAGASPLPPAAAAAPCGGGAAGASPSGGVNIRSAALTRFLLNQQQLSGGGAAGAAGSPLATTRAGLAAAEAAALSTPAGATCRDLLPGSTPGSANGKADTPSRWLGAQVTPVTSGAVRGSGGVSAGVSPGDFVTPQQQQPLQAVAPVAPLQQDVLAAAAAGAGRTSSRPAAVSSTASMPLVPCPFEGVLAAGSTPATGDEWQALHAGHSNHLLSPDLLEGKGSLSQALAEGGGGSPCWTQDMVALLRCMQETPLKPPCPAGGEGGGGSTPVPASSSGGGSTPVRRARAGKTTPNRCAGRSSQGPRLLHVAPGQEGSPAPAATAAAGGGAGSRPAASRMRLPAAVVNEAVSQALQRPAAAAAGEPRGARAANVSALPAGLSRLGSSSSGGTGLLPGAGGTAAAGGSSCGSGFPVMLSSLQQAAGGWQLPGAAGGMASGGVAAAQAAPLAAPVPASAAATGVQQSMRILPLTTHAVGVGPSGAATALAGPSESTPAAGSSEGVAAFAASLPPSSVQALRMASVESNGSDTSSNKENHDAGQALKVDASTGAAAAGASGSALAAALSPAAAALAAARGEGGGGVAASLAGGLAGLLQAGVAGLLAGVKQEGVAGGLMAPALAAVGGMASGPRPGDGYSSHHLRSQLHAMIDRL